MPHAPDLTSYFCIVCYAHDAVRIVGRSCNFSCTTSTMSGAKEKRKWRLSPASLVHCSVLMQEVSFPYAWAWYWSAFPAAPVLATSPLTACPGGSIKPDIAQPWAVLPLPHLQADKPFPPLRKGCAVATLPQLRAPLCPGCIRVTENTLHGMYRHSAHTWLAGRRLGRTSVSPVYLPAPGSPWDSPLPPLSMAIHAGAKKEFSKLNTQKQQRDYEEITRKTNSFLQLWPDFPMCCIRAIPPAEAKIGANLNSTSLRRVHREWESLIPI